MPEQQNQFFKEQKAFNPLEELYMQYVRSEPTGDLDAIMAKMINLGFPILGWGNPPEMKGGKAFFHEQKEFLPKGTTYTTLDIIFQKVVTALLEQGILQIDYT